MENFKKYKVLLTQNQNFRKLFDHFGDIFGSAFGGGGFGRRGGSRVRKGSDWRWWRR